MPNYTQKMKNFKSLFDFGHVLLAATIAFADQAVKAAIRHYIPTGTQIDLGILSIVNVQNTGVSFGLFKGYNPFFIALSFAALAFFLFIYRKKKKYGVQISLICAGIIGNLTDRIFFGHVLDFLDFRFFPVFNIADSAITIGIAWLTFLLIKSDDDLF